MVSKQNPAEMRGPEPQRPTYGDGAYGSEEQRTQPDGSANMGASYTPGTVRTGGNLALGIVIVVAFLTLIGLYALFLAQR